MILPPTSENSYHHKVTNLTMSPTSLSPTSFATNRVFSSSSDAFYRVTNQSMSRWLLFRIRDAADVTIQPLQPFHTFDLKSSFRKMRVIFTHFVLLAIIMIIYYSQGSTANKSGYFHQFYDGLLIPYCRKMLFDRFTSGVSPNMSWKMKINSNKTSFLTEDQMFKDKIAALEFQKRKGALEHS